MEENDSRKFWSGEANPRFRQS